MNIDDDDGSGDDDDNDDSCVGVVNKCSWLLLLMATARWYLSKEQSSTTTQLLQCICFSLATDPSLVAENNHKTQCMKIAASFRTHIMFEDYKKAALYCSSGHLQHTLFFFLR